MLTPAAPHPNRTERFDLNALYETSRLLSASLDLEFVLSNLLLTAMSKLLVTRGAALLYEPIERRYRVAIVRGRSQLAMDERIEPDGLLSADMLRGDRIPESLRSRQIELVLPVRYAHREIGQIALGPKATGGPFENAELQFLQSLVNMTSAAVHNSLMVRELEQANRDLDARIQGMQTLIETSREFNATVDRKQVLRVLSFTLMGQVFVTRYLVMVRRPKRQDLPGELDVLQTVGAAGLTPPDDDAPLVEALGRARKVIVLDEDSDPLYDGLRRRGLKIMIPLVQNGHTCGILGIGPKRSGEPFGQLDYDFLDAFGNLALTALENTFLVEEQIDKERLEEEMRLARAIQERLLPQDVPHVTGLDIGTLALPSRVVGGDYFDVVRLAGGRLLLAIADVTGKGLPASLLMANLQACLHTLIPIDISLEEAVVHINRVICDNTGADKFITFFAAIYHPTDRRLEYVNAGHNPPVVVRRDGSCETLETGGLLLGVMKNLPYEKGLLHLEPGDLLALYTDGVTEAMNLESEEYGEERLHALLTERRDRPARRIVQDVLADLNRFSGGPASQSDDITMIVLRVEQ